ncbi:hypothetical protein AD006_04965 [Pseudonocardia sp. EC080610-09]|nr:hypothetical protein FRP1_25785 [Pseudonocardia sp. EC080625-04]ALL74818.1 hypothetical protein AD006_04965 [Pseudonocardia sp. EC080610-09]ALL81841.1 hypothetical protein AD017_12785 [Pseudonocardia sp. EC080619-01]
MTQEANTVILQILLLVATIGALVYFVRSGQSVGVRASKRLAFGAFVVLNIYAILRPDDVTFVARALGIGRGTDLIVYLLVVAFVFGMLNTYLRDREISQHLTNLARQIAVRDAELSRREEELARRLDALDARDARSATLSTNGNRLDAEDTAAGAAGRSET